MKNIIKDLAASNEVRWGTIAEKIDENFSELENLKAEGFIPLTRDFSDDFNNDFTR